jgi:holo-[acyl-carrier protein] synthase
MLHRDSPLVAIGTDIVRIARVDESLRRFGDRFVRRIFTQRESAYCDTRSGDARVASYAARFAAKEAVMKALGVTGLPFTDVEIVSGDAGEPAVRLHKAASDRAVSRGLAGFALSLAHEDDYAVATVVGLPAAGPPGGPSTREASAAVQTDDGVHADCRVPLLSAAEATSPRITEIYRIEERDQGRVRNLTRVSAHSAAVWQLTTRALALYGSLRRLDRPLVDLLCLYTSLLNGCRYCIDDAAGEALRNGWRPEQLLALGGRHERVYPPAMVVALHYAETLTRDAHGVTDGLVEALREHYDSEALLELTVVIGMKNFWNRLATAIRIPAEGKCTDADLLSRLLDLSRSLRGN